MNDLMLLSWAVVGLSVVSILLWISVLRLQSRVHRLEKQCTGSDGNGASK